MKAAILVIAILLAGCFAYSQTGNKKGRQLPAETTGHLKLYPKEADKYVNIYVEYDQPTDFTLTLVGVVNRNDEKKWTLNAKTSHQQSLDITNLPKGIYTIVLEGGGAREQAMFSVKR